MITFNTITLSALVKRLLDQLKRTRVGGKVEFSNNHRLRRARRIDDDDANGIIAPR